MPSIDEYSTMTISNKDTKMDINISLFPSSLFAWPLKGKLVFFLYIIAMPAGERGAQGASQTGGQTNSICTNHKALKKKHRANASFILT